MNGIVYTGIKEKLNELGFTEHDVYKMYDKNDLFEELYNHVRYERNFGAELTMVALTPQELEHYFCCCYIERYDHT